MTDTLLLCTVGGAHEPILTAIKMLAPRHVCFLCTNRDPATSQPGSRIQIEGKGNVIKARATDTAPTLPNIPAQVGLPPDRFEARIVPADDLDAVVTVALSAIDDLRRRFPEARLVADYTGGTKSMSAGLVLAALESDVALHLVTGARGDLVRVHGGTQYGTTAAVERVRLHRALAPCLAAWRHHGYGAAALALEALPTPSDATLRGRLQIARGLSRAFDAWDRFDHAAARDGLALYRQRIGAQASSLLNFVDLLCLDDADPRKEPARLLDLWRNAERRAAQGRYDDAVARAYRLLEWTAQWLLRTQAGIETSDIPADKLPPDMILQPSRNGRLQAGLHHAWRLIAAHVPEPAASFARDEAQHLLGLLDIRNQSIFAHGFRPIAESDWNAWHTWLDRAFVPLLLDLTRRAGIRATPPQLPIAPIWD